MKKVTKWLLLLLAGGCSLVIAACYGVPPEPEVNSLMQSPDSSESVY